MSVIRKEIQYTGTELNFNIKLKSDNRLTGLQQDIDNYAQIKSANSINGVDDGEIHKFRINNPRTRYMSFEFSATTTTWLSSFISAGFTSEEVNTLNLNYQNSFFILDFFDTYKSSEQRKIFTSYLTKLYVDNSPASGTISIYTIGNSFQFSVLNVPVDNLGVESGATGYTGYTRFSFYNAKTGKVIVFFNKDNDNLVTEPSQPDKMYFKTTLDLVNKTWDIITPSFDLTETLPTIFARQLTTSPTYVQKVNDTFNNFENLRTLYPDGTSFNPETGKYYTN